MNKLLASTLSTLNALYAVLILVFCVVIGGTYMQPIGTFNLIGALVGGVVGLAVASLLCGLVAFLTIIEKHLSFLAASAEYQNEIAKMKAKADQRD